MSGRWGEGDDGDGGHAAQWTCQQIAPSRETWHVRSHISTTGHRYDSLPLANNNESSLIITIQASIHCLVTWFVA